MDIASLTQTFKQVFEIFENSNISQGTVSQNPQNNEPDKELVAEFENYLQEPNSPEQADLKQADFQQVNPEENLEPQTKVPSEIHAENIEQTAPQSDIQEVRAKPGIAESISVEPQEYFAEIQNILTQLENNSLNTGELFRLQYLTNMLNVRITQNNSLSKSTTEQFETVLKQQG